MSTTENHDLPLPTREDALTDLENLGALAIEAVCAAQGEHVRDAAVAAFRADLIALGVTPDELDAAGIRSAP